MGWKISPPAKIVISSGEIRPRPNQPHGFLGQPESKRTFDRFSGFSAAHGYVQETHTTRPVLWFVCPCPKLQRNAMDESILIQTTGHFYAVFQKCQRIISCITKSKI